MGMKCYYSILGVKSDCGQEEIRTAYRRLAKTHHPDHGGDPGLFHDIRNAYETLSDLKKRREYDSMLADLPFGGKPYKTIEPVVVADPVDVYDDLVSVFGRRFGFETRSRIKLILQLSSADAKHGVNIEVPVPIEAICHHCFGFGGSILSTCRYCGGKGTIKSRRKLYFTVEPDTRHGDSSKVRFGKTEVLFRVEIRR